MADEDGIVSFPKAGLVDRPLKACDATDLEEFNGPPGAAIDCTVSAAVFDESRGAFLVTLPSTEGQYANSFATMDAQTGALSAPTYVGSAPAAVALASDSESVYVGLLGTNAVLDLNLTNLQPTVSTRLQSVNQSYLRAGALASSDDDSGRVLMGTGTSASPSKIELLQDGVVAENSVEVFFVETLTFDPDDNSVAYALDRDSLYILDVTADGVSERAEVRDLIGGEAVLANGKIYDAEGQGLDPTTLIVETVYDFGNARVDAIAYDPWNDHLYYYRGSQTEALVVVNATSNELVAEYVLPVDLTRTVKQLVIGNDSVLITEDRGRTLLFPKATILQ